MKKLAHILLAGVLAFPAIVNAATASVVTIELTPKGWFTKPVTCRIGIMPDGSTSEMKTIMEVPYFTQGPSHTIMDGSIVTDSISHVQSFGLVATVSIKDGITSVKISNSKLIGNIKSSKGYTCGLLSESGSIETSFAGSKQTLPGFANYKRVVITVL